LVHGVTGSIQTSLADMKQTEGHFLPAELALNVVKSLIFWVGTY